MKNSIKLWIKLIKKKINNDKQKTNYNIYILILLYILFFIYYILFI